MMRFTVFAAWSCGFLLSVVVGASALAAETAASADSVADLIAAINKSYAVNDLHGAIKAGKQAYKLCWPNPEKVSPSCEIATSTYAFLLETADDKNKAIDVFSTLIDYLSKTNAPPQKITLYYVSRARLYRKKDKFGTAKKDYLAAFDLAPKIPPQDHRLVGMLALEYTSMEHSSKDTDQAKAMLDAVIAAARNEKSTDSSYLASALLERARFDEEHRDFSNAAPFIKEAYDLVKNSKNIKRDLHTSIYEFYAMDCEHTGKKDEAARVRNEDTEAENEFTATEFPGFNAVPVRRVHPEYPMLARYNDLDGWVILSVTIGKDGSILKSKVVDSYPMGVFEQSTITAASDWKYHPTYIDGQPVIVPDHYIMFEFRLTV